MLPLTDKVSLPMITEMSEEQFEKVLPYWTLWRFVGQKPSEFLLALKMPNEIIESFMELDDLFDRLSRINAERIAEENKALRSIHVR